MRFQNQSFEINGIRDFADQSHSHPMLTDQQFQLTRRVHVAACFAVLAFVTWGLLTQDPLASVRNTRLAFLRTVNDIIIHCSVYTVLSVTCLSLLRRKTDRWVRVAVIGLLVIHGIGTELLQTIVPNRMGDPLDAIANMTGISFGAFLAARLAHWLEPATRRVAAHRSV